MIVVRSEVMCLTCHSIAVVRIAWASGCVCYGYMFTNENSVCCFIDLAFSRISGNNFLLALRFMWIEYIFSRSLVHFCVPFFLLIFFLSFFSRLIFRLPFCVQRDVCILHSMVMNSRSSTCRRWCSLFLWLDYNACVCVCVWYEYEWVMWNASKINLVRTRWNGRKKSRKNCFKCATTKIVAREIRFTSTIFQSGEQKMPTS